MKLFFSCLTLSVIFFLTSPLWASAKPDFSDPDAVLADMRAKTDDCSNAGAQCSVSCGYGLKTMKNFLKANPEGDPSILQQRWQPCYEAHRDAGLQSITNIAKIDSGSTKATPDFTDHAEVVSSIKSLQKQCGGEPACEKNCNYALKAMKNFNHPQPHYANIRKGKWESCRQKVPGMKAVVKPKTDFDISRFTVAGLPLGGDMQVAKERFFLLKAHGYFKKSKREYGVKILPKKYSDPAPDIIKYYEGSIKETTVYVFFEATADGSIYKIQFEQKEPLDVDQVAAALIKRYGKPTKQHGNYLNWGCDRGPKKGFCVKANPGAQSLTIWAFSEDVKKTGYKQYEEKVLKEKGVKGGAKF